MEEKEGGGDNPWLDAEKDAVRRKQEQREKEMNYYSWRRMSPEETLPDDLDNYNCFTLAVSGNACLPKITTFVTRYYRTGRFTDDRCKGVFIRLLNCLRAKQQSDLEKRYAIIDTVNQPWDRSQINLVMKLKKDPPEWWPKFAPEGTPLAPKLHLRRVPGRELIETQPETSTDQESPDFLGLLAESAEMVEETPDSTQVPEPIVAEEKRDV
eukprot:TRINITY_DN16739_c0_g1_i1.p1 TRINITY_DN16739_c0_g1~~TRINITY_DN16739_c0_g1_i1.p1  ORF type:complete len:211 (-),score=43.30 TRINITY_DN16739_c0_g1_i1:12-644(-)